MSFVTDLNTPLLRLSPNPQDSFTLANACTGVHVFGGIGSGKTSGSGKMLAGAYLRAGFGGVVSAVKPQLVPQWQDDYAPSQNRTRSIVLFDETQGFNFLEYELSRHGADGIGTIVEYLIHITEAAKTASSTSSQKGGDAFWMDATRQFLRYAIPPLYAATGTLSIEDIIKFISSAPSSRHEVTNAEWQRSSFMYQTMDRAANRPVMTMSREALEANQHYWSQEYPAIPDKTRGNITISLTAALDRFRHGRLKRAFCGKTTIVPEMALEGAVILLAMPTLTWNEDGVIAQKLFKYAFQRCVLNRNSLAPRHRERPVFLFSDEAQETVSSYDGEFMGLCRDSKCCVVYLTQSLPTYYSKMGGDNARDAAQNLVGKFMTHLYHSNSCPETNDWASRTIGKAITRRRNYSAGSSESRNFGMTSGSSENEGNSSNHGYSSSHSGQGGSGGGSNRGGGSSSGSGSNWGSNRGRGTSENESRGYSESMEFVVEPGDFARVLKTGGRQNRKQVTGFWFQSGRVFKASGTNVLLETFNQ